MNRKAKGSRRERQTRDYFLKRGYDVIKAGASLGKYDLVAMNEDRLLLIQCKSNKAPPWKEKVELMAHQNYPKKVTTKWLVIWVDHSRAGPEFYSITDEGFYLVEKPKF